MISITLLPGERGSAPSAHAALRPDHEVGPTPRTRPTLPRLLRETDLTDVNAEAFFPIASPACAVLEAATVAHVREALLAAELATPEEIQTHLANFACGDLDRMLEPMITAWGRKPA